MVWLSCCTGGGAACAVAGGAACCGLRRRGLRRSIGVAGMLRLCVVLPGVPPVLPPAPPSPPSRPPSAWPRPPLRPPPQQIAGAAGPGPVATRAALVAGEAAEIADDVVEARRRRARTGPCPSRAACHRRRRDCRGCPGSPDRFSAPTTDPTTPRECRSRRDRRRGPGLAWSSPAAARRGSRSCACRDRWCRRRSPSPADRPD